ncbi:unnamed protein product [Rhizoctonia solani]|uniref:Uncharacterized protein n=1 Tax=Rhizoctonia solani TaxID=456999 RepID=A0A8H3GZ34_9AGAM|nr:unnamed protein product [Rhizoctonia solani]
MSWFVSARLPSAPTPGASPYLHDKVTITKRAALGLEALTRIPWAGSQEEAAPFFDWCRRHANSTIQLMQLRKERVSPFFHEYITFRLNDRAGCFRIDRRQRSDIRSPMKCTEDTGVEAFDSIEEIVDMEDSMYNPSDCLVHVDFATDVYLCLITDFCMAVSKHEKAQVYTVQRYNCYFYAQSMILYVLCWAHGWTGKHIWETYYKHEGDIISSDSPLPSREDQPSIWRELWTASRALRGKPMDSPQGSMQESTIGDLQKYLSEFIYAHGVRVEQHKALLNCTARNVEDDVKKAIDQIWENSMKRVPMILRWRNVGHEIWYYKLVAISFEL